jgi:tetratricopeptide (TPR) repeat protein
VTCEVRQLSGRPCLVAVARRERRNNDKAIEYYEQALQLDPHYALVMVQLAGIHFGYLMRAKPDTEVAKARQLVDRAIALDPQLASAYVARASIQTFYDYDWAAAELSVKRARELEPANARVLSAAATQASILGRFSEGRALHRQALERNPLNPALYTRLGIALMRAGDLPAAEANFRKALELDAQRIEDHSFIALTLLLRKQPEMAVAEAQLEPSASLRLGALTIVYHALGRKAESDAALRELTEKHASDAAFLIAQSHGYRGEVDQAINWLERARQNREGALILSMRNPVLRPVAHDPRFKAFLRKMNLPTQAG